MNYNNKQGNYKNKMIKNQNRKLVNVDIQDALSPQNQNLQNLSAEQRLLQFQQTKRLVDQQGIKGISPRALAKSNEHPQRTPMVPINSVRQNIFLQQSQDVGLPIELRHYQFLSQKQDFNYARPNAEQIGVGVPFTFTQGRQPSHRNSRNAQSNTSRFNNYQKFQPSQLVQEKHLTNVTQTSLSPREKSSTKSPRTTKNQTNHSQMDGIFEDKKQFQGFKMHHLTDMMDKNHKINEQQIIIKIAQNGRDLNSKRETRPFGKGEFFDSEQAVTIQGTHRDKEETQDKPVSRHKTSSLNRPSKGPYFILKNIHQLNREKSKVIKDQNGRKYQYVKGKDQNKWRSITPTAYITKDTPDKNEVLPVKIGAIPVSPTIRKQWSQVKHQAHVHEEAVSPRKQTAIQSYRSEHPQQNSLIKKFNPVQREQTNCFLKQKSSLYSDYDHFLQKNRVKQVKDFKAFQQYISKHSNEILAAQTSIPGTNFKLKSKQEQLYENNYPGFGTVQENFSKNKAHIMTKLYNEQQKNTVSFTWNKQRRKRSPHTQTIVNIQVDQLVTEQTEKQPSGRRQNQTPIGSDLPEEFSTLGSHAVRSPKMLMKNSHVEKQNKTFNQKQLQVKQQNSKHQSEVRCQKGTNTSGENPYIGGSKEQLINIQVENSKKFGTLKCSKEKRQSKKGKLNQSIQNSSARGSKSSGSRKDKLLKKNSTLSMLALNAQDIAGSKSKSKDGDSNYLDDPVYEINRMSTNKKLHSNSQQMQQKSEQGRDDSHDDMKQSPQKKIGKINIQNKKSITIQKQVIVKPLDLNKQIIQTARQEARIVKSRNRVKRTKTSSVVEESKQNSNLFSSKLTAHNDQTKKVKVFKKTQEIKKLTSGTIRDDNVTNSRDNSNMDMPYTYRSSSAKQRNPNSKEQSEFLLFSNLRAGEDKLEVRGISASRNSRAKVNPLPQLGQELVMEITNQRKDKTYISIVEKDYNSYKILPNSDYNPQGRNEAPKGLDTIKFLSGQDPSSNKWISSSNHATPLPVQSPVVENMSPKSDNDKEAIKRLQTEVTNNNAIQTLPQSVRQQCESSQQKSGHEYESPRQPKSPPLLKSHDSQAMKLINLKDQIVLIRSPGKSNADLQDMNSSNKEHHEDFSTARRVNVDQNLSDHIQRSNSRISGNPLNVQQINQIIFDSQEHVLLKDVQIDDNSVNDKLSENDHQTTLMRPSTVAVNDDYVQHSPLLPSHILQGTRKELQKSKMTSNPQTTSSYKSNKDISHVQDKNSISMSLTSDQKMFLQHNQHYLKNQNQDRTSYFDSSTLGGNIQFDETEPSNQSNFQQIGINNITAHSKIASKANFKGLRIKNFFMHKQQKRIQTPETAGNRKFVGGSQTQSTTLNEDLPLEMRGTKNLGGADKSKARNKEIKHKLLQNSFRHQTPLNFLPGKKFDVKEMFHHDKLLYIEQIQREIEKYKRLQKELTIKDKYLKTFQNGNKLNIIRPNTVQGNYSETMNIKEPSKVQQSPFVNDQQSIQKMIDSNNKVLSGIGPLPRSKTPFYNKERDLRKSIEQNQQNNQNQVKPVGSPGLKGSPLKNRGLRGRLSPNNKKVRRISFIQNKANQNPASGPVADNSVHQLSPRFKALPPELSNFHELEVDQPTPPDTVALNSNRKEYKEGAQNLSQARETEDILGHSDSLNRIFNTLELNKCLQVQKVNTQENLALTLKYKEKLFQNQGLSEEKINDLQRLLIIQQNKELEAMKTWILKQQEMHQSIQIKNYHLDWNN